MNTSYRLPNPQNQHAGRNNRDAGQFAKIAAYWRPSGTSPGESITATVARFCGKLINLATGQAMSADEILSTSKPQPGTPVHATGPNTNSLTITAIAAGDQVILGDVTYTFADSTIQPYEIYIGNDTAGGIANLAYAVNTGSGGDVGAGTDPHPHVTAVDNEDGSITFSCSLVGAQANLVTDATGQDMSFTDPSFLGGTDATPASAGDQLYDADFTYLAVADIGLTSESGWTKTAHTAL
jgi:hypothetical protein